MEEHPGPEMAFKDKYIKKEPSLFTITEISSNSNPSFNTFELALKPKLGLDFPCHTTFKYVKFIMIQKHWLREPSTTSGRKRIFATEKEST